MHPPTHLQRKELIWTVYMHEKHENTTRGNLSQSIGILVTGLVGISFENGSVKFPNGILPSDENYNAQRKVGRREITLFVQRMAFFFCCSYKYFVFSAIKSVNNW